ncbi:MAG: helix-turn-helix domain-containing protein [Xanthomonadales bacterium]|nr:helix-turn-helix domain-containing protein [Xanthomonadales bacterium]
MAKTIYRDEYRQLVDQLREKREALGISQAELARRLDRNQQWVSLMERGSRRLDVIEFVEVCVALGSNPISLIRDIAKSFDPESRGSAE